jgi:hypothetical protein
LQALQREDPQYTQAIEHQQGDGVRHPALLLLLSVDTGEAEERRLYPTAQGEAPCHDGLDGVGQRPGQQLPDGQMAIKCIQAGAFTRSPPAAVAQRSGKRAGLPR